MPAAAPRVVRKCDILSWQMKEYVELYIPWNEGDTASDNRMDSYGHDIGSVSGPVWIGGDEAKAILEAYEKRECVFAMPFEDITKKGPWVEDCRLEVAKGLFFKWHIAKAIASYFKNGKHLHYLDNYDLKSLNWTLVD